MLLIAKLTDEITNAKNPAINCNTIPVGLPKRSKVSILMESYDEPTKPSYNQILISY